MYRGLAVARGGINNCPPQHSRCFPVNALVHCRAFNNKSLRTQCALGVSKLSFILGKSVNRYAQCLAAGMVFAPGMVCAQEAAADARPVLEEVIVTGTQMRGVDPVGAEVIAMDVEAIASTGATTTTELLANIPQLNSFGTTPAVTGRIGGQLSVNRVNVRNLPQGTGSASPTLVLMDGHRLVGMGVRQNYPDPDVVPPGALQRVDVLTDGGSAIYGADAIGGVVNFVTRKDVDGLELNLRQGFGDSYYSTDASVTVGNDWGETSALLSYNYQHNDAIYGKDRSYVKDIDWETGIPAGRECDPGNVAIGTDTWAINPESRTLAPGLGNACDTTQNETLYPEGERNSVFAGFSHSFTDSLHFDLQAWYTRRENTSDEGPLGATATVASSAPGYISTGGPTATRSQSVGFDFSPINGRHNDQNNDLETWGLTPTLTWDIGARWQMRAFYNYGYAENNYRNQEIDTVAVNAGVAAGTIDPYDIARSDASAIDAVFDLIERGYGEQELHDYKAVFDGPLLELPGGELRLAIGAEYIEEDYQGATGDLRRGERLQLLEADRDVTAYFAELNIPVVGFGNQLPGIYELTFSLAYRVDDYSDFGEAESPNVAVTYMPVEWLTLRGLYNEGFQAPGLANLADAEARVGNFPSSIANLVRNPDVPVEDGQVLIVSQGTKLPLDPQTSENWNIGFDVTVPFVEGLEFGASMYHIEYTGQIDMPPVQNPGVFYSLYSDNYLMLPSKEEAAAYLLARNAPADQVAQSIAAVGAADIYAVLDARASNLGFSQFEGYDFFLNYVFDTSFGSLWANFNGTYLDESFDRATELAPKVYTDGIESSRFNYVLGLGAYIGNDWSARASVNYVDGYELAAPAQLDQTEVDSWYTVNLYAQYNFPNASGWAENLSLSIGATNVFDEEPPLYRGRQPAGNAGYVGGTLGRVVTLGIAKTF